MKKKNKFIHTESDWTFEVLDKYDQEIGRIAKDYLKLDTYPNQIEIVTSEQMLDAYSLIGLPVSYPHWTFGKSFVSSAHNYVQGVMGLAYELVINTNPVISYNMEDNTSCMMAVVLAHAAYGHNSFFKNNYLFKQWTDAAMIIDYMVFARDFVLECEEKYGEEAVEEILDSCHSLMEYGVDKYKRPTKLSVEEEKKRIKKIRDVKEENYNDLWDTLPPTKNDSLEEFEHDHLKEKFPKEPQENILHFIEKHAPSLKPWKRELIRIVRRVSQYFYPQSQCKVMNEGWATFCHYHIIHKLYEEGLVDDGFMMEFYTSHTAILNQLDFDQKYFHGLNPYALGFKIFMDIKRICEEPTDEDREWFPNLAGKNWLKEVHYAMENYRDESFILQYLSPKVIRDMKMFTLDDNENEVEYNVSSIHNERGYKKIRENMAKQHSRDRYIPNIQVTRADKYRNRKLTLTHYVQDDRVLEKKEALETLQHIHHLWEFDVKLYEQFETGSRRILHKIADE